MNPSKLTGAGLAVAVVLVLSVAFVAVNGFNDVPPWTILAGFGVGGVCGLGGAAAAHLAVRRTRGGS